MNINLPASPNVPLKVITNVNQGVTGVTVSTSLVTSTASNIVAVDSGNNNDTVQNVGTINSAITTFSSNAAVMFTPGSAPTSPVATTPTSQPNTNGNVAVTWPFTFTVSTGSSPVYISATPSSAVTISTDLSGTPGVTELPSTRDRSASQPRQRFPAIPTAVLERMPRVHSIFRQIQAERLRQILWRAMSAIQIPMPTR